MSKPTTESRDQAFDAFCRKYADGELATDKNSEAGTMTTCQGLSLFFRQRIERYEAEIRSSTGKQIHIHLAFNFNPTLNAFAARYDVSLYFIGINTGALAILGNAYEQLFAHATFLRDGIRQGQHAAQFRPAQLVVWAAFSAACDFLLNHELGHIVYGHTDLVSASAGGSRFGLFEANETATCTSQRIRRKEPSSALFQSMEVDADLHAATAIIGTLSRSVLCGIDMSHFFNSHTDLCRISVVAILVMFHLFYGKSTSTSDYVTTTHPLPEIRLMKFLVRAKQLQMRSPDIDFDVDVMKQAIADITTMLSSADRDTLFPCLRLEGGINMVAELMRVRRNEDIHEKELKCWAKRPVGWAMA